MLGGMKKKEPPEMGRLADGDLDWVQFCYDQWRWADEEMKKKNVAVVEGEWDWLGYAIHKLGGPGKAAVRLGISRQTLYTYLGEGLGSAQFRTIIKLSQLASVPYEYLAKREGPFEGPAARPE